MAISILLLVYNSVYLCACVIFSSSICSFDIKITERGSTISPLTCQQCSFVVEGVRSYIFQDEYDNRFSVVELHLIPNERRCFHQTLAVRSFGDEKNQCEIMLESNQGSYDYGYMYCTLNYTNVEDNSFWNDSRI